MFILSILLMVIPTFLAFISTFESIDYLTPVFLLLD